MRAVFLVDCRYRKFVEGVFFNDQDVATNTTDGEDNDDEDYVPPKNDTKRVGFFSPLHSSYHLHRSMSP